MSGCTCGHHHHGPNCGRPAPVGAQVALSGRLICAGPADLMAVLAHVEDHVASSRAEPGCLYFAISQTEDPLVWQVEELFRDEEALAAHRGRVAGSQWATATAGIGRDIHRITA